MSDRQQDTEWKRDDRSGPAIDDEITDASKAEEQIPPIIKPGDHRNPADPKLPLVSPIVDGGNL